MMRQVALKVRVKDLVEGGYVKKEGWDPNFIELPDGRRCSRANVIAVVISTTENNLTIDDGSASIVIRSFEPMPMMQNLSVGDVILVIGRPREYQDSKYIMPEIIKKITNPKWVEVRKKELQNTSGIVKKNPEPVVAEEKIVETEPQTDILSIIRKLDKGDGADIEEITSQVPNADSVIEMLLKEGEIFELRPGRLKVLE